MKLRSALARIANAVLDAEQPRDLGSVVLTTHQSAARARVEANLARHGGALLADEVGRGKTFVALAVARRFRRPLVVLPASLRDTWSLAMRRAGVSCTFVTHETLSAGRVPAVAPDLVIVDESHRFRNPRTRRHAALARLCARAPVVMLSATPVQNSRRDLAAQLSLFLGGAADVMTDGELASHVVRAGTTDMPELPAVAPPRWIELACNDEAVLDSILALPSPPRALDAGDAGLLRTLGLVRAWASSRAALHAALRRRSRTVAAIEQCVAEGRIPARSDLRIWAGAEGEAVQLGFVSLLLDAGASVHSLRSAASAIAAERDALDRMFTLIHGKPDSDLARLAALREVRRAHPGEKVLAFTEFASTARAFATALEPDGEVGLMTARGARIASGSIRRRELLERFAPGAHHVPSPPARERVSLLVTTDLLSEGVNLQDASVVVHLDLPWNPARLTQRIGRVRRPGGHDVVHAYLLSPPANAERLLEVEERLRAKLASAAELVGRSFSVVPRMSREGLADARPAIRGALGAELHGDTRHTLASWRRVEGTSKPRLARRTLIAAVHCDTAGWLAATRDGRLLARLDGESSAERSVHRAVALVSASARRPRACDAAEAMRALRDARERLAREAAARECGSANHDSSIRRAVVRRADEVVACAPRHQRAALVSRWAAVRRVCAQPLTLGVERELESLLASSDSSDASFVERAAGILADAPRSAHRVAPDDDLAAVVLLGEAQ